MEKTPKSNQLLSAELLLLVLFLAIAVGVLFTGVPMERINGFFRNEFSQLIFYLGIATTVLTIAYLLLQAALICFYRAVPEPENWEPPGCTVVVPAYNEGERVMDALNSLLACDYPADKLQIIAVDDGSKDDTWEWINRAAAAANGRITPVRMPRNGGKKRALTHGFRLAKYDFVMSVDSDSIVKKDAIRNLMIPFANPKIGAVAGAIRVRNLEDGIIPKMMDVAFVFGCEFMRCAQSVVGTVLCTPGAISAYRRSAVLPHLEEWLQQTFLGAPATIGEDRALTSLLLRSGYQVICQNNAVADTEVPSDYPRLCKMLLRWTRGDIRESLMLIRHFCKRFDLTDFPLVILQINLFSQIIGVVLPFIFLPSMIYFMVLYADNLLYSLYYTVVVSMIWAILPAVLYAKRKSPLDAVWSFVYGVFSVFALSWICIYSCLTIRNSKWLTR